MCNLTLNLNDLTLRLIRLSILPIEIPTSGICLGIRHPLPIPGYNPDDLLKMELAL